jgi:quercetin dioxygenase-like cupin family protein
MKRARSLVPLSHDHHHALVEARRLRRAADAEEAERRAAVAAFLRFFAAETVGHFRQEEEVLFPTLATAGDEAGALLVQALLDHQRIHALTAELERGQITGKADAAVMQQLAELVEQHVRLEERQLFPLIEALVDERTLAGLRLRADREQRDAMVELDVPSGGPVWGKETEELNATLLAWPAGGGAPEHVNTERDVVIAVLAGSATVTVDGEATSLGAGQCAVIEKGRTRSIAAGPRGVRYLSVHRRRAPLQITRTA